MTTEARLGRIEAQLEQILAALPPVVGDVVGLKVWRGYMTGAVAMLAAILLGCLIPLFAGEARREPALVATLLLLMLRG